MLHILIPQNQVQKFRQWKSENPQYIIIFFRYLIQQRHQFLWQWQQFSPLSKFRHQVKVQNILLQYKIVWPFSSHWRDYVLNYIFILPRIMLFLFSFLFYFLLIKALSEQLVFLFKSMSTKKQHSLHIPVTTTIF